MSMMKCPDCRADVSTLADRCPTCRRPIQEWIESTVEESSVLIPISPVEYWNNWHFWYRWGCRTGSDMEITFCKTGWVEVGDPLFSLRHMQIRSPFAGLIVDPCVSSPWIEIRPRYGASKWVEMRIKRNSFREDIGQSYFDVVDFIYGALPQKRHGAIGWLIDSIVPSPGLSHVDPKNKFESVEEYVAMAHDLYKLKAYRRSEVYEPVRPVVREDAAVDEDDDSGEIHG